MSRVAEYLNSHSSRLRDEFNRLRVAHADSDVKGAGNEAIVGQFLANHLAPRRVVYNSSIIDSEGRQSGEVDIAVCKDDQPFVIGDRAQLLLVEGIDLVVQVKARLSSDEILRVVTNARSVKQLVRWVDVGDRTAGVREADLPHFVHRTAYVAFCFESELTPETATVKMREACEDVPSPEQPDAIFVLDRAAILNTRENDGITSVAEPNARGFVNDNEAERALLKMMQLISFLPRVHRATSPLRAYWS